MPEPGGRGAEGVAVAVVGALISCTGALLAWRADLAGATAASYDRQGIVEAVRYQAEAERAETDARTEQRTYVAHTTARLKASEPGSGSGALLAVERVTQRRLAERLARAFPPEFVRSSSTAPERHFDAEARAAELLREREVHDDSARLFTAAGAQKDRRQALRAVVVVLVLGLAATAVGHLSDERRFTLSGIVGGCLALGYGVAVLATVGF